MQERTACINRIRGLLAEFGLVFAKAGDYLCRGSHGGGVQAVPQWCAVGCLAGPDAPTKLQRG